MGSEQLTVAVIGAGGKMGMRVAANLDRSQHEVLYSETSPAGQERVRGEGRQITDTEDAVRQSDVVILAVPDVVLGDVSNSVVPQMKTGAILLTLDPAAAYAGLLAKREDVFFACAHPCHPSVFLERTSKEEWADTFGGIAAPQDAVAALEAGGDDVRKTKVLFGSSMPRSLMSTG
jgi:D-apionate oxidoisomerase